MERQTRWTMSLRLGTVAMTSLLLTAGWIGCGGETGSTNSVTASASGSSGGGGGPACGTNKTICDGNCVDVMIDAANCGACGMACGQGEVCVAGACALNCGGGATKCGTSCVDIKHDPTNCGNCGTVCVSDQVCDNGTCSVICSGGTTQCGNSCINTQNDPGNCGACSKLCGFGEVCSQGACGLLCTGNTVKCGGTCANIKTDTANCGSCFNMCGPAQVCSNGVCSLVCGGGTTKCGGSCVDTQNDPMHCGDCQTTCGPYPNATGVCVAGTCASLCGQGHADCNNIIADGCEATLSSDPLNCGGCGVQCLGGLSCMNGTCTGPLSQLSGTNNVDVIRGDTYNTFFTDPVTGKVYWGQNHFGVQLTEYPNMANFQANSNGVTINLPISREGTYLAAINGSIYCNAADVMYKINAANGAIENQALLANAGYMNQSHFNWGGYTDIDFFVDTGNLLYVMYAPAGSGPITYISRLDPSSLAVQQTWNVPTIKTSTGFAFLVNGRFYIGNSYDSPGIVGIYTLSTSTYDAGYTNSLTPVANDYVAHTYWDPGGKRLLEVTASHHLVYPNVQ